MELANIEKLLEKYENGETTIAEEKALKTYFSSADVAPHLTEYKILFRYFSTCKNEQFTKTIQLNSQPKNWKWLTVVASIILLISVYTGYQQHQHNKAEKIFKNTQMALNMLSSNLNKGTVAIEELQEFEVTKNKIFKQFK
jgi:hypothetical protein